MDAIERRVRIEFVGEPSPYADPAVQWALARGKIHPEDKKAIRIAEDRRQNLGRAKFHGRTIRTFGREHGFSRDYQFGPTEFVVEMTPEDAARLLDDPIDARLYRDLDAIVVARR